MEKMFCSLERTKQEESLRRRGREGGRGDGHLSEEVSTAVKKEESCPLPCLTLQHMQHANKMIANENSVLEKEILEQCNSKAEKRHHSSMPGGQDGRLDQSESALQVNPDQDSSK